MLGTFPAQSWRRVALLRKEPDDALARCDRIGIPEPSHHPAGLAGSIAKGNPLEPHVLSTFAHALFLWILTLAIGTDLKKVCFSESLRRPD
jgi:hypothetical protein